MTLMGISQPNLTHRVLARRKWRAILLCPKQLQRRKGEKYKAGYSQQHQSSCAVGPLTLQTCGLTHFNVDWGRERARGEHDGEKLCPHSWKLGIWLQAPFLFPLPNSASWFTNVTAETKRWPGLFTGLLAFNTPFSALHPSQVRI